MQTRLFSMAQRVGKGMCSTPCIQVLIMHYVNADDATKFLFDTVFTDQFQFGKVGESGFSVAGSNYSLTLTGFEYKEGEVCETSATYNNHDYIAQVECYDNFISVIIEGEIVGLFSYVNITRILNTSSQYTRRTISHEGNGR